MTLRMKFWGPECFFPLCYVRRFGGKGHFRQNLCIWSVWFLQEPCLGQLSWINDLKCQTQINWTKMKSGQSLVSAELIPYRSFTLLVVTLATMNLVIIEFGLGIKSSHFALHSLEMQQMENHDCLATQRLAASTLGLRYKWIRSQI